jgi:hypothetical protein
MTVSRLLENQTAQERFRGNVLIVDEADMVSGRQMEGLLDLARREDARICSPGTSARYRVSSPDAVMLWNVSDRTGNNTGNMSHTISTKQLWEYTL